MTKEELLQQFDTLRTAYIKAINDKDVIISWGKPQLEALYNTKIGIHQLALLQLQLQTQSLKRKLELVRSAVAKGVKPDLVEIELIVATELANAELKIMKQTAAIENSKDLLKNLESPTRSAELRKLYKQMAKQLHPDVNENLNKEQKQLWLMVKEAYKYGDVEKLKVLQIAYEKELTQSSLYLDQLTEEELKLKIETLKEGLKLLHTEINTIKSVFPFTIELQIKDDAWVMEQIENIEMQSTQIKKYQQQLLEEYNSLINDNE